ncbi:MAG TPA: XdhC family protein, partial [Candidatus Limnocylindria bacterium]|nr:XdhC family protein [Candidatus Limnocylindria bacterium]
MTDEALAALRTWQSNGTPVALATVTRVTGSAPRQPGSKLAISSTGEIAGSVSGGCVEGDVIEQAMHVLRDGTPRLLHYGISDEMGMSVGLMCGGQIDVVIEPAGEQLVEFAAAAEVGEPVERAVPLTDFRDRVAAPPRLWVVGAGHVAEHVVAIAARAGFAPVVVDPRRLIAQQDRFADAQVRVVWPDVA